MSAKKNARPLDLIWDVYEQPSEPKQAELLRTVFKTVVLDRAGIVGFTLNVPFDTLTLDDTNSSQSNWRPRSSRPRSPRKRPSRETRPPFERQPPHLKWALRSGWRGGFH